MPISSVRQHYEYTNIIASVAFSLGALLTSGCVTDGAGYSSTVSSDSGDSYYSQGGDFRAKVHRLREHYARVREEAEYRGAHGRVRDRMMEISAGIDRVAGFVYSGQFSPERAQENISRLHSELREVSDQIRL